jgi:nicotinamidase/pyrazinamidase
MKTIFVDVDTQLDFLLPAGALYAPGAEEIAPALGRLTAFAAEKQIPIVSTVDSHTEDDPEFKIWKPHCVIGTYGQQKYSQTIVDAGRTQQVIVAKHTVDVFASGNLGKVIDEFAAERYVVYGLVTEYCVQSAALGVLKRGGRVEVVKDAIKSFNEAEGRSILEEIVSQGGRIVTASEILAV